MSERRCLRILEEVRLFERMKLVVWIAEAPVCFYDGGSVIIPLLYVLRF